MNIEPVSTPVRAPVSAGATWTNDRVAQLRSSIAAGLTCSQIADQIGVTRNAVIGKMHRLGLAPGRRPATAKPRVRAAPTHARGPQTRVARILRALAAGSNVIPFQSASEAPPVESAQRCSLLDLTGSRCRWPLSDPGKADFGFCGNDALPGLSYCAGHARIAYRLPSGRRA